MDKLKNAAIVLRKIGGQLHGCFQTPEGPVAGPTFLVPKSGAGMLGLAFALLLFLLPALLILGSLTALVTGHEAIGAAVLTANGAAVTTRPLATILKELKELQVQFKGKVMPEAEGQKFAALAAEAKAIQDEADRETQVKSFERFASEVTDPALPAGGAPEAKADDRQIAGYISLGELFVNSEVFQKYRESGNPMQGSAPLVVKSKAGERFVALSGAERKAVEKALRETKAAPTIGAGVIEPQRLSEIVRVTEHSQLTLRQLLNVSQTNSNAVEYARLASYTRAAAPVADQAAKPEATAEFDVVTTPVRTQAVWMPVTEQQIQDAAPLVSMIDDELLFDLDKLLEEQVTYGSGAGQNFGGIFKDADVVAARESVGDTLIDKIRRAITDVAVAGYMPNGVAIHPYDWEDVQLLKGSDDHYIWVVVTGANGDRIWALPVVQSIAMEDYTSGNTTDERNVLVGDFIRGATLWDRQQSTVQMGWINDQFTKNMRTIRAERRAAFGIKRPKAFRKIETVAAVV